MFEWNAALETAYDPINYRLHVWRLTGSDRLQFVSGRTDEFGRLLLEDRPVNSIPDRDTGLVVPPDMIRPIHGAFSEHLAPLPSAEVIAELREQLKYERWRIDGILKSLFPREQGETI